MTKMQCAYAAGLVDGEGCISIARYQRKNRKIVYYHLSLCIRMTDPAALNWLAKILKKPARKIPKRAQRPKWKPLYHLELTNQEAQKLLRRLLPFLTVKFPHARLALKFPASKIVGRRGRSVHFLKKCEQIYQKFRKLNQRGTGILIDNKLRFNHNS